MRPGTIQSRDRLSHILINAYIVQDNSILLQLATPGLFLSNKMTNDTKSISGVTSFAYHTTMWILVIAGLLGNLFVLVWRCSRKESRHSLLSVLIISLAFADLLFCCHFLLEEAMLANSVFASDRENLTIHVTTLDERLCLGVLFFVGVSCNGIMLTAVAIALATFFSFRFHRYGNRTIIWFLVISWIYCLAFGGLLIWKFRPTYQAMTKPVLDVNTFSLFVVYECTSSQPDDHWNTFPIIVTTLNAMASLFVAVIYIYLWCALRKHVHDMSFTRSRKQEMTHFRIRLTIISGLNLLCWWPACFLYWFATADSKSVFTDTLSPVATEPVFAISAAVSVANPIIYTIASKRFFGVARRVCACLLFCRRRTNEELLPIVASQHTPHGEVDDWGSFCCRLCPCQRPQDAENHPESVTDSTEESSLFPESE